MLFLVLLTVIFSIDCQEFLQLDRIVDRNDRLLHLVIVVNYHFWDIFEER